MTTAQASKVAEIAQDLVEKCRKFQFEDVMKAHYSPNIVSIESAEMPGSPKEVIGLDNVMQKSQDWVQNTEIHSMEIGDAMVGENQFAVQFTMDVTCKRMNQRFQMTEMALYTVENGKIIREQFFYNPQG